MKGRTIVLDDLGGREAAALMVDGRLEDILIDGDAPRPGTIYRAIAERPMKGQGGVFLRTPDGPAYLRQIKGLAPGDALLVQVTGYAERGKALPVTTKLLFKSRYAIITPDAPGLNISRQIKDDATRDRLLEIAHDEMADVNYGLILRSVCEAADTDQIQDDIAAMRDLARAVLSDKGEGAETLAEGDDPHAVAWRDWVEPADVVQEPGSFEALGVLDALDLARGAREELSPGAMFLEQTRALVAVDVNTGGDSSLARD